MVNKNIVNNALPMHQVKDQLKAMSRATVFSAINITKGYHQKKLAEVSKIKKAFTSP